jgi:hypothetical protein
MAGGKMQEENGRGLFGARSRLDVLDLFCYIERRCAAQQFNKMD